MRTPLARAAALLFLALAPLGGCSRGPAPSHAGPGYRSRLTDDTLLEAASTVLVTTKEVVVAAGCAPLRAALESGDSARIDRAVAAGTAVRLPAGVTLYTPPFGAGNPGTSPLVVTDDRAVGRLCTPGAYDVLKS